MADETGVPTGIQVVRRGESEPRTERWGWEVGYEGGEAASGASPTAVEALEAAIEHLMGFEFVGGATLQHTKAQRFRAVLARRHALVRRLQRREAEILGDGTVQMVACPNCEGTKTDPEGQPCRYCRQRGRIRKKPDRELITILSTAVRTQLAALAEDAKMLGVDKPPPDSDGGQRADEFAGWRKGQTKPKQGEAGINGEEI